MPFLLIGLLLVCLLDKYGTSKGETESPFTSTPSTNTHGINPHFSLLDFKLSLALLLSESTVVVPVCVLTVLLNTVHFVAASRAGHKMFCEQRAYVEPSGDLPDLKGEMLLIRVHRKAVLFIKSKHTDSKACKRSST